MQYLRAMWVIFPLAGRGVPAEAAETIELPQAATAATFYLSPTGNDAWSGTLAEPNPARTDGPFATLERAREALRAAPPDRPRTVILRGGVYPL